MDLVIDVQRPEAEALRGPSTTSSARVREVVAAARERQRRRLLGTGASANGEMDARTVQRLVGLSEAADRELSRAYSSGLLSARGRHRVLRVARTIADLGDRERISRADVLTALSLRQRTVGEAVAAG